MSVKLTIDLDKYFALIGRKGPPSEYDLMKKLTDRREPALNPDWDPFDLDDKPTFSMAGCSFVDSEGDFVDFLDISEHKKTFLHGWLVTWDRKATRKDSVLIGGIPVDNWSVKIYFICFLTMCFQKLTILHLSCIQMFPIDS